MMGNTKNSIDALISQGRLPHAIVVEGSSANKLADYIARAAVCIDEKKPCGKCNQCKKANDNNHADIKSYEGTGAARSFHIDVIREIRLDAFIIPNEAQHKVYILRGAENMSDQAQNALLKLLEEPPEYIVFILTCSQKSALLETVLSRSVILYADDDTLNQDSNEQFKQLAEDISLAVISINELDLLKLTHKLTDKNVLQGVLDELLIIFRQVYFIKSGVLSENEVAKKVSGSITMQSALNLIDTIAQIKSAIDRNANAVLNTTRLCSLLRTAIRCV